MSKQDTYHRWTPTLLSSVATAGFFLYAVWPSRELLASCLALTLFATIATTIAYGTSD